MLTAIIETLPKFRELKVKAQCLGHKNGLPFYDLFAPLGIHNQDLNMNKEHNMY